MRIVLMLLAGWTSIALGLLFLPLPTPFGVPLFLIGAGLILVASPAARRWFKQWRGNHRRESDAMSKFEGYLPGDLKKALDETHPDTVEETMSPPDKQRTTK